MERHQNIIAAEHKKHETKYINARALSVFVWLCVVFEKNSNNQLAHTQRSGAVERTQAQCLSARGERY